MNLIRNTLPSSESQNPSTSQCFVPSVVSNRPWNIASVKGLLTRGEEIFALISTKSYTSILLLDWENETARGETPLQAVNTTKTAIYTSDLETTRTALQS